MALSTQQEAVLKALDDSEGPLTTHEVGDFLRRKFKDSSYGYYGRASGVLRRMEKRGLVSRTKVPGHTAAWSVTRAGKDALPD